MPNPQIQTRVDDRIEEAVEEYAEREQTNKSTAVRQFLLAGMADVHELPEGVEEPKAAATSASESPAWVSHLATLISGLLAFAIGVGVLTIAGVFSPLPGTKSTLILTVISVAAAAALYLRAPSGGRND
jgi:hypothetical protein